MRLKIEIPGRSAIDVSVGHIQLRADNAGVYEAHVRMSEEQLREFLRDLILPTAGFGDGYGSWTVIGAQPGAGNVCIKSTWQGKDTYVLFLPGERDKLIGALNEAFDNLEEYR